MIIGVSILEFQCKNYMKVRSDRKLRAARGDQRQKLLNGRANLLTIEA